jgi:Domain of unknown function (DUF4387)
LKIFSLDFATGRNSWERIQEENSMPELWQLTRLIRSKNAGPFELTFDLIFKDREGFDLVKKSGIVSAEAVSRLYGVPIDEVRVFELPAILALKISMPRPAFSGDIDDTDVYGGQFHSRLVRLSVPEDRRQESGAASPA